MNIIILGAGEVGASLAENLTAETQDITLIDTNDERLNELQARFDLRTVHGIGSHPSTLAKAGAANARAIIAVTNNDEANMVACQVAHTLFKIPIKIARIRAQDYLLYQQLFGNDRLPIDIFFSPELLVTQQIQNVIQYPGTNQVLDLGNGLIKMIAIYPQKNCLLLDKPAEEWKYYLFKNNAQCIAIFRNRQWISINSNTSIDVNDELFILVEKNKVSEILKGFGYFKHYHQNIMVGGGGNLGFFLSKQLEKNYYLKIIELSRNRCALLSQDLKNSTVLCGNICDTKLLNNENIEEMDVFCAITNDDADNIIAALEAKQLGAKQVISLVTRSAYMDLIESGSIKIDIAISPQRVTADAILVHLQPSHITHIYSIRKNGARIIELLVESDKFSKIIGRRLHEIHFKKGFSISAIIRNKKLITPDEFTVIQPNDSIIFFIRDKNFISNIEDLI